MRPAPLLWLAAALASTTTAEAWRMAGPAAGVAAAVGKGGGSTSRAVAGRREGRAPVRMQLGPVTSAGRAFQGDSVGFLDPREAARPSLEATEARFLDHLRRSPFVAVLRGVEASDVAPTLDALAAEGLALASIPAEAPAGLAALRGVAGVRGGSGGLMLGAATVVSLEQVEAAAAAGAGFVSCPHVDPEIIERAIARGMVVLPGVLTPTEAFLAVKHGARVLKLFPSPAIPPGMVKSLRAVLPPHVQLLVSGGVQPEDMPAYLRAGAIGFALGSTLYKPGLEAEELRRRARLFVDAVARGRETDAWAAATLGL